MKALIVGLGGVGQRHARNLRSLLSSRVELLAYRVRRSTQVITATLEADSTRNVETELGIQVFDDLEVALSKRPEIALICNPTSLHVETATACLSSGCDLFIEKPLSDRLEGVDELVRLAELSHRVVMVGYQLRFHPCVRTLASILETGTLGQILAVRAIIGEYLPGWHPYEDYRQGYAAKASLGGGVVLTQIHEFDYLYSLFGAIKSVYALGGHWSHLDVDVEDVASILMEGTVGDRPLPIHLHQDYLQRPGVRQCEVIGEQGKAVVDFRSPSVAIFRGEDAPIVHAFPTFERNQMFIDEIQHFLACVESRSKPIVDLNDSTQSLKTALAAKQSIASRGVVRIGQERHPGIPVSQ